MLPEQLAAGGESSTARFFLKILQAVFYRMGREPGAAA